MAIAVERARWRRLERCWQYADCVVAVVFLILLGFSVWWTCQSPTTGGTEKENMRQKRTVSGLWEGRLDWLEKTSQHRTRFKLNLWYRFANRLDWQMRCRGAVGPLLHRGGKAGTKIQTYGIALSTT